MTILTQSKSQEPMAESENSDMTVADAVWIGTALLHQQSAGPFPTETIVAFVENQKLTRRVRKSIWQHVNQHCVANRKAQPNNTCMLFATGGGNRRLFRDSDHPHPDRKDGRTHPAWEKLPPQYAYLRHWYETVWNISPPQPTSDPLLDLIGTGSHIWKDEHADEYVERLRSNWGDTQ